MVFSSLLFVFLFLALNLVSQAALRGARQKNIAMLLFSLVFFSWAGPRYVVLLLLDTALCWFFAICIEREPQRKKLHLSLCVALVLLVLGIFKYTGFLMGNLQSLFGWPEVIPQIVLPIGISFYTFQLISYVVDVYRGEVRAQKKYWILLLYASLFHQCIAGPIVRYRDVAQDLAKRQVHAEEVSRGISRFTVGLAKKAVLANSVAVLADRWLPMTTEGLAKIPTAGLWLGGLCYMLQIYLDFSAYSDMAIGMGLMCCWRQWRWPGTATIRSCISSSEERKACGGRRGAAPFGEAESRARSARSPSSGRAGCAPIPAVFADWRRCRDDLPAVCRDRPRLETGFLTSR